MRQRLTTQERDHGTTKSLGFLNAGVGIHGIVESEDCERVGFCD